MKNAEVTPVWSAKELSREQMRSNVEQQQPRPQVRRVQARAVPAQQPQAPAPHAPNLMGAAPAMQLGANPIRIPDRNGMGAGGGSIRGARSVFDESVRGNGAQVQQVRLMGASIPLMQDAAVPQATMGRIPPRSAQPHAMPRQQFHAGPNLWLGQEEAPAQAPEPPVQPSAIERVVQREMPSAGFSPQEAGALADALTGALESAGRAVAEGVVCGNVDTFVVQEVRVLQGMLQRFASSANAGDRFDGMTPEDLGKIDAVLACQVTYDQVAGARSAQTTALVIGGIVVGGIVLAIVA